MKIKQKATELILKFGKGYAIKVCDEVIKSHENIAVIYIRNRVKEFIINT